MLGLLCLVVAYTLQIPAFPFPVFLLGFLLNGFGFCLLVSAGLQWNLWGSQALTGCWDDWIRSDSEGECTIENVLSSFCIWYVSVV